MVSMIKSPKKCPESQWNVPDEFPLDETHGCIRLDNEWRIIGLTKESIDGLVKNWTIIFSLVVRVFVRSCNSKCIRNQWIWKPITELLSHSASNFSVINNNGGKKTRNPNEHLSCQFLDGNFKFTNEQYGWKIVNRMKPLAGAPANFWLRNLLEREEF